MNTNNSSILKYNSIILKLILNSSIYRKLKTIKFYSFFLILKLIYSITFKNMILEFLFYLFNCILINSLLIKIDISYIDTSFVWENYLKSLK